MRFLVDSLPYYQDYCPFQGVCPNTNTEYCPCCWDKEFVCSDENPHCCLLLREEEVK